MWWSAAHTVQHRICCVTFNRRPLLLLWAGALNWIITYDGTDGGEVFCFSSLISVQGRWQVCTSHWVSTCWHNQELAAASLPRWRKFWFRESIACLWDVCKTTSEVCIPGQIPQCPILPSCRAAQQSFAHSLSDSSCPPSSDGISLPEDVYEPCGKGRSTRGLGLRDLSKSCWALCEQVQVHGISFHDTHRLTGGK